MIYDIEVLIEKLKHLQMARTTLTLDELADLVLEVNPKCVSKECDYYSHYLVYYNPDENGDRLMHDMFHPLVSKCLEAQDTISKWMRVNTGDPLYSPGGKILWDEARRLERRVAA